MAKFVLAYTGGSMAETPEAQEAVMQQWMGWFGELGSAVVDGGNPFGASTAVKADGSPGSAAAGLTGLFDPGGGQPRRRSQAGWRLPGACRRRHGGGLRSDPDVIGAARAGCTS